MLSQHQQIFVFTQKESDCSEDLTRELGLRAPRWRPTVSPSLSRLALPWSSSSAPQVKGATPGEKECEGAFKDQGHAQAFPVGATGAWLADAPTGPTLGHSQGTLTRGWPPEFREGARPRPALCPGFSLHVRNPKHQPHGVLLNTNLDTHVACLQIKSLNPL